MSLKSLGLKAAIAMSVLVGTAVTSSPAHALSFGSQLDFGWTANASNTSIDFYKFGGVNTGTTGDFTVGATTGSFSSASYLAYGPFQAGTIKDLPNFSLGGGLSDFLFFGASNPINFKLKSFALTSPTKYSFAGIFADGTLGTGELNTQITGTGVKQYAATIVAGNAVPTPALLPGLIALGAGVLKKRKAEAAEATEVVEAEAWFENCEERWWGHS